MPSATASSAAVARPWSSRWAMTSSARDWPALPGLALQRSLASCSVTAVAGSGCGSWSATALSTTHSPLRCTRQRFPAGAVRAAREREASAGLAAASRQTERRASVPTGPSSQTKRNSYDGRGRGPGIGDALITPTRGRRTLCSGYMTVRAHLGAGRPASVSLVRSATGAVGIAAALAALYKHVLRKPILNWGATDEEASARMPGDELLERADGVSTRAIEIDAPPAAVWPWLAQMGPSPRGGAYTYDWIENLLGLNMHSTARVLPEFQHPQVGDTFRLGSNRMRMDRVESERVLAWRSEDGNWVWTFVLEPRDGGTRLISRNRFRLPALGARIAMLPMEPGSFLMERKMLRGIKQRAERLSETLGPPA